jgi:hypothetical protein
MSTIDGDDRQSVLAKYIDGPEKEPASPPETLIKQSHRHADLKAFLAGILLHGPTPATLVEERGAAHGYTEKQLRCAKERMNIVAVKETGKPRGRWLWALPHDIGAARRGRQASA